MQDSEAKAEKTSDQEQFRNVSSASSQDWSWCWVRGFLLLLRQRAGKSEYAEDGMNAAELCCWMYAVESVVIQVSA